jgi:hypothetical protein
MKKLLLILLCLPLLFSSCQKCQECIPSETHQEIEVFIGYEDVSIGWYVYEYGGFWIDYHEVELNPTAVEIFESQAIYETQNIAIPRSEVCRDNFNSKSDFEEYINHMEEDLGYSCKSDFWN